MERISIPLPSWCPVGGASAQVYAYAQSAVVYAYQLIVGEEASARGVDNFLIVYGEELPLSDAPYALYDGRRAVYRGVVVQCQPARLDGMQQPCRRRYCGNNGDAHGVHRETVHAAIQFS